MTRWNGTSSTTWTVNANWDGGAAPSNSADVTIDAAASHFPILASSTTINALTIDAGSGGLVIGAGSTLGIAVGLSLDSGYLSIGQASQVSVAGSTDLGGRAIFEINTASATGKLVTNTLYLGGQIEANVIGPIAPGGTVELISAQFINGPSNPFSGFQASASGLGTLGHFFASTGSGIILKVVADHEFIATTSPLYYYFDARMTGSDRFVGGGYGGDFYQVTYNITSVKRRRWRRHHLGLCRQWGNRNRLPRHSSPGHGRKRLHGGRAWNRYHRWW